MGGERQPLPVPATMPALRREFPPWTPVIYAQVRWAERSPPPSTPALSQLPTPPIEVYSLGVPGSEGVGQLPPASRLQLSPGVLSRLQVVGFSTPGLTLFILSSPSSLLPPSWWDQHLPSFLVPRIYLLRR